MEGSSLCSAGDGQCRERGTIQAHETHRRRKSKVDRQDWVESTITGKLATEKEAAVPNGLMRLLKASENLKKWQARTTRASLLLCWAWMAPRFVVWPWPVGSVAAARSLLFLPGWEDRWVPGPLGKARRGCNATIVRYAHPVHVQGMQYYQANKPKKNTPRSRSISSHTWRTRRCAQPTHRRRRRRRRWTRMDSRPFPDSAQDTSSSCKAESAIEMPSSACRLPRLLQGADRSFPCRVGSPC